MYNNRIVDCVSHLSQINLFTAMKEKRNMKTLTNFPLIHLHSTSLKYVLDKLLYLMSSVWNVPILAIPFIAKGL